MPEIQHTFTAGKMNKDLDERILPNGEYRDALNIQVASSDGDDVGAVQNVLGNQLAYSSKVNITGSKCIGGIADTENEKIYWFINGTSLDAIAEYDQISKTVSPVLVDKNDILNLGSQNHERITGINLIDGMLFWTDNESEPKVINVEACKAGTANFNTHTQLKDIAGTLYNFTEEDIVVIKQSPKVEPTLTMANTKRVTLSGVTGVTTSTVNFDFGDGASPTEAPLAVGSTVSLTFNNSPTFKAGDTLILSAGDDANGFDDEYQVRVKVNPGYNYPASTFQCTILSISEDTPTIATQWEVNLKQDDPLFEKEFVRFAYRYKYQHGEYSCFSPFSDVAFLPKTFEYDPAKGFNLGMVNDLRYLKITNFIPSDIPKQVKEIDILFKKENNTNIYVAKTVKYSDEEWSGTGTWELESEMIYKTVETNQLLRPYDNVPLKAQAQELVGNRIVYGNYVQNFDLVDSTGAEISPKFEVSNVVRSVSEAKEPEKSLKSQRTYQLGVVYLDKYGRETPVQGDNSGVKIIAKDDAINYNQFEANIISQPPTFATHYKFFIKDTANSYYNLCMDRWYDAEDGNVWLTFPSSERNKIDEETFLIIKKQHNDDVFVQREAKYKVIAIESSAPTELKETKSSYGELDTEFSDNGFPIPDGKYVNILKEGTDSFEERFGKDSEILSASGLTIRIKAPVGTSKWYDVATVGLNNNGEGGADDEYKFSIKEKFGSEVEKFFPTGAYASGVSGMSLEIARTEIKNKPEFTGRFFVKVYKDQALEENILNTANLEGSYSVKHQQGIWKRNLSNSYTQWRNHWEDTFDGYDDVSRRWFQTNHTIHGYDGHVPKGSKPSLVDPDDRSIYNNGIKLGASVIYIFKGFGHRELSPHYSSDGGIHADMLDALTTDGTKFRFTEQDPKIVYTIEKHGYRGVQFWYTSQWLSGNGVGWASNKGIVFALELDKPIEGWSMGDVTAGEWGNIEILQTYDDDNTYKSQNPAIWETEPKESIDMDLYYEASKAYAIATHGTKQTLNYFNCWSFGNGVESNRIRDDYNTMTIAKGVKASAPLAEQYEEERRKNGLIFSGLYNSTSGINRLNQFILAEPITKDLNPEYGSIQKIHQRDTDLTVCCEDKILKVLANKDALYEASGNPNLTATNRVLGQSIPYIGDFGISKNPESFASYGFRSYFTDKARGVVLRLSRNGLTPISSHGMVDYFRDNLALNDVAIGNIDDGRGIYNLTLKHSNLRGGYGDTLSFKEQVAGWPSRKSWIPDFALSLNNTFYSWKDGEMYSHNSSFRNTFYESTYRYSPSSTTNFEGSRLKLVLNDSPATIKSFKTISYEGSQSRILTDTTDTDGLISKNFPNATNGWYVDSIVTNKQNGHIPEFIEKEGKWFNYIKGDVTTSTNLDTKEFNVQGIGNPSAVVDSTTHATVTITIEENAD
jgi:hypothetical protein